MSVLETSVGRATVLHRLAVAVECRDALSNRPVESLLTAYYRRIPTSTSPDPVWRSLDRRGTARFTLRHTFTSAPPLPDLEILVDDPSRRLVPRRFTISPWQLAEVAEPTPSTDPSPYIEPRSRLLRVWLLPGAAYAMPRTATVIRGRVTQDGKPKRWARLQGTTPTSDAGWAHTDERGEFLLPIVDAGANLTQVDTDELSVTLRVIGMPTLPDPLPANRAEDLISEVVVRSTNPPADAELDNDLLRGIATPDGYVENASPSPQEDIPVARETQLTDDVVFIPHP